MPRDRTPGAEAPIASWIHQQALKGTDGGSILEGVCEQLLEAGIEIERAVVAYVVFHPQFDGMNFTWTREKGRAERQAVTRPHIFLPSPFLEMQSTGIEELRYRLDEVPLPFALLERLRGLGLTDYFAFFRPFGSAADQTLWPDLPDGMTMREGITASFATRRARGFSAQEIETLRELALPVAVAVKVGAILEMAETLLGAYLGTASGASVFHGYVRRGQGQIIHAVVWYSDLRGSTTLAESGPLESYLATLNGYYDCIVDVVIGHGGEVLKFIGDGVLAMFPFEPGNEAHADAPRRALAAARDAFERLDRVNVERSAAGMTELRFGIALHAGEIMYGNVGSAQRLDFTVMGRTVNEVVRLETLCKKLEVPIVVSQAFAVLDDEPLVSLGWHTLAGVARQLQVFSLPAIVEPGCTSKPKHI